VRAAETETAEAEAGDRRLLFATRFVRLFAYGLVSIVLVLYLKELGFGEGRIGLLLTLTLVGDTLISLWLTTRADRVGRRRTLVAGAVLMTMAGAVFALTRDFTALVVAATIGVISPSGNEVGPFLSIEQAALSHVVADRERTRVFAWYSLAGSLATAAGAMAGGALMWALGRASVSGVAGYRVVVWLYAACGVALAVGFTRLSRSVEVVDSNDAADHRSPVRLWLGLGESRRTVLKLSALFALDAFGGGFVIQSLMAYWFHLRFGVDLGRLGGIFFTANVLAGLSALLAARIAGRIGLLNTMVLTHLPSNVLLILVPLMPDVRSAVAVLWVRFSISQMDVPTRQSYTMAVVRPAERSAAAGVTGVARTIGAAISPAIAGAMLGRPAWIGAPFFLAGGSKIVYDLILYRMFRGTRPPEERAGAAPAGAAANLSGDSRR